MEKSMFSSLGMPLIAGILLGWTAMFLSANKYTISFQGGQQGVFLTQSLQDEVVEHENSPLASVKQFQEDVFQAQKDEALAVEQWKQSHPDMAKSYQNFRNCGDQTQISQPECKALVELYTATNGDGWTKRDNWLDTISPCEWYGVECASNGSDGLTVVHLSLYENNLVGTLPMSLGDLGNLQTLLLAKNQISGEIPMSLGSLTKLKQLSLAKNKFEGAIPESFGKLRALNGLYLFDNTLSGPIPASLGNLTNLYTLDLVGNELDGQLPDALGKLINLGNLALLGNQFSGPIPESFGNLVNLQQLSLDYNQLTGPIPVSLGNLKNAQQMSFEYNQLCGALPETFMQNDNIKLWVDNNQLLINGYSQEMTSWLANHLWSNMPPNGWGVQDSQNCPEPTKGPVFVN